MNLTTFLKDRGFTEFESYGQQVSDLIRATSKPNIRVMEVGFNAGLLAEVFLQANKTMTLTSFDLGGKEYVAHAKEFFERYYPVRHQLILGDTKETVPQFRKNNPGVKFDFIFIDGHDYATVRQDIANCRAFAHSETVIALTDTMYKAQIVQDYTRGPTATFTGNGTQGEISQFAIQRKDYSEGRGMSWGKFMV